MHANRPLLRILIILIGRRYDLLDLLRYLPRYLSRYLRLHTVYSVGTYCTGEYVHGSGAGIWATPVFNTHTYHSALANHSQGNNNPVAISRETNTTDSGLMLPIIVHLHLPSHAHLPTRDRATQP